MNILTLLLTLSMYVTPLQIDTQAQYNFYCNYEHSQLEYVTNYVNDNNVSYIVLRDNQRNLNISFSYYDPDFSNYDKYTYDYCYTTDKLKIVDKKGNVMFDDNNL